jgi:hypothetical protein
MKLLKKHGWFFLLMALLLGLTGFFREFVFENINFQIYKLYYNYEGYTLPESLSFLEKYPAETLNLIKYPLTLFTVLVYFGYSWLIQRRFFPGKNYFFINLGAHLVFILIGILFYLYGILFNDFSTGYKFSRIFFDFVQTPLLIFILVPGYILYRNSLPREGGS